MPTSSATRPARLSTTMRRVRLEEARWTSQRPKRFSRASAPRGAGGSSMPRLGVDRSAFMPLVRRIRRAAIGEASASSAVTAAIRHAVAGRQAFPEAVADAVEGLDHFETRRQPT